MKISVVAVGKTRGPLGEAIREFENRASHYWKLEVTEVESGVGRSGTRDRVAAMKAEAGRLIDRVPKGTQTWALTRKGSGITSVSLANALGRMAVEGSAGITFLIGGAHGLDDDVIGEADRALSLSRMTFPHEMARLLLAEQLYRAGTILRSEPYHKGES